MAPAFAVLVSRFDEQHKGLIKLINDLHSAMKTGRGQVILGNIFDSLVDYTKNHFADEEAMGRNAYPNISRHKIAHEHLLKRVTELQEEFVKGTVY